MRPKFRRAFSLLSPAKWARFLRRTYRRLSDRFGIVPTAETRYLGRRFAYPSDSIIGWQIADGGEWDPVLQPIAAALLTEREPVICEVGSNIGASLLQILAAKPAAHIIAFEPSSRFLPFFRRNLEGFDSVEIHSDMLGREPGSVTLFNNASTASAARKTYHGHEPRRAETVAMTTLDAFCLDRERLDFLKVDTDGYDFEVLRGGEQSLKRHKPVLFFEFTPDFLEDAAGDLAWLQGLGYRRFSCFGARGQLIGTSDEVAQAIAWAKADPSQYVDILTCPQGAETDARRETLVNGGTLTTERPREAA